MEAQAYARIDNGVVAEMLTTSEDIATLFHPALTWVATTTPSVAVGWTFADGVFSPPAPTLAQAQAAQIAAMYTAYQSAIAQDVSFTTAAGVTQTFQADVDSMDKVQKMLSAYSSVGVPAGFWWKSRDNTHVAFVLADLHGLARVMGDQGWAAFQRLDERKASIMSATTVADVQAVVW